MEVENKDEFTTFEDNHFVAIVHEGDELVIVVHDVEQIFHIVHFPIEIAHTFVHQIVSMRKTPLSTAPMVTPIVASSREVNPLRVTEFVTHEVKVSLPT